ncbi:hypothetical protein ACFLRB_06850 [Acidobacteriota bacterium]
MTNGTTKPPCGTTSRNEAESIWDVILILLGLASTLYGVVKGIYAIITMSLSAVPVVSVLSALAVFATVSVFHYQRCYYKPDGAIVCTSGIINNIVRSFNSTVDEIFPFVAQHDRVDVVLNPHYWPEVEEHAYYVNCANDPDRSPFLKGFYKSKVVCAAGLGSVIGGGVGAIGGVLLGSLVGAVIGCATVILCLLALIVALLIAAVVTLVGAIIGGRAGKTIAEGRAIPPDPDLIDPL